MESSRTACSLCLSENEFCVSLYSNFSRRNNLLEKVMFVLKQVIEDRDEINTICYKCTWLLERFYEFMMLVKVSRSKCAKPKMERPPRGGGGSVQRLLLREQVFDADYTFSFLELPEEEQKPNPSSPFFSYFSPPSAPKRKAETIWKTPKPRQEDVERKDKRKMADKHNSRDLFESQSQEEAAPLNWNLTPDDNILKKIRNKCFGVSDF